MPTTCLETFSFQAETKQLLHLMIHSLYTEKAIFLRELISNASDALDRLRLEALTNAASIAADHKYEIRIKADPSARTLTVSDSGIGMRREDLIANIGTIARSGTQELRQGLEGHASEVSAADLIGQFGVGFYSSFMVADRVKIITRHLSDKCAVQWESSGNGTYQVNATEKENIGTDVTLYLKKPDPENGIDDYAERSTLASLVKQHSDLIAYPIIYEPLPGTEPHGSAPSLGGPTPASETLNSMIPIWSRRRSQVTESEYKDFYRRISSEHSDPLRILPLKAEGTHDYEALLFFPAQAPFDLFHPSFEAGLRLYARRVLVMERCADLLPRYLRFVRGVVDASELPLNISRQRLQQDRHIAQIRKWLTKKVLEALAEMQENEPQQYLKFWNQCGRAVKEGVGTDYENKERLLPLLLFESSNHVQELTTFAQYVGRMKAGQNEILYLTGESRPLIEHSPHLEVVKQSGYEVLYLKDPVDEWLVQRLQDFSGKRLKSVAKGTFALGTEEQRKAIQERISQKQNCYADFLESCQKQLSDYIKEVRLSARLVSSAACLVSDEYDYSPHLERLLRTHASDPRQRRIMEVNPDHAIVKRLYERFTNNRQDSLVGESVELLFELAWLAETAEIRNLTRFSNLTLCLLEKIL